MANPQTEDGFVMIALDLFPAVMSAGLSGYAQIVLAEVLLQWAGPQKRRKIFLLASDIQHATGLGRSNARRAIRELVAANILHESGTGFAFNKNYDTWTPHSGPLAERLGGRMIEWIKESVERHAGHRKHKRTGNTGVSTETHQEASGVSIETHEVASSVSIETHESRPRVSIQTHPHIEERARQKTKEEREERLETGDGASAPRVSSPLDPEYAEVGNHAIEITGDLSWGRWVSDRGRDGHSARLIRQAIDDADGRGKLDKPYVLSILHRCARQGITDLYATNAGPTANATPGQRPPGRAAPVPTQDQAEEVKRRMRENRERKEADERRERESRRRRLAL